MDSGPHISPASPRELESPQDVPVHRAGEAGGPSPYDRPPLPQPPQEPPPRAATPYAAGGAALVGPGCPPARVSLYPPRRLVAGGDPSQISARL